MGERAHSSRVEVDKKMKVLMIPDCWGWAHEFNARGVKKYSRHDVEVRPLIGDRLTWKTIRDSDVIFCFSQGVWYGFDEKTRRAMSTKPLIFFCCGTSFVRFPNPPGYVRAYATCTERLAEKARKRGIKNVVPLKEGVDTEIFKPLEKSDSTELRVGWAGNPEGPAMRVNLLKRLKYPVKIMGQHGKQFFVKNRSRQPMVDFYNNLDVYLVMMETRTAEGVGLTVLEAMACGLPVVSTDSCEVSLVVQPEWLVPIEESSCIKGSNRKLTMLDEDRELLKKVGERNLNFIRRERSWKIRVKDWDKLFENVFEMPAEKG